MSKTAIVYEPQKMSESERDALVKLAMSMYLGEFCPFCGWEFKTLGDLEGTVFAGYSKYGRIAHKVCWEDTTIKKSFWRKVWLEMVLWKRKVFR